MSVDDTVVDAPDSLLFSRRGLEKNHLLIIKMAPFVLVRCLRNMNHGFAPASCAAGPVRVPTSLRVLTGQHLAPTFVIHLSRQLVSTPAGHSFRFVFCLLAADYISFPGLLSGRCLPPSRFPLAAMNYENNHPTPTRKTRYRRPYHFPIVGCCFFVCLFLFFFLRIILAKETNRSGCRQNVAEKCTAKSLRSLSSSSSSQAKSGVADGRRNNGSAV